MNRASNTPVTRRRRKKVLKQAKGYFGSKHKLFKTAKEQVMRSLAYSYEHRKKRYPFFRSKI
jgi:large subunit ribosomal protein L20